VSVSQTDRPAPDWLIDESFEDRVAGVLKSGKEAEVFLVERRSTDPRDADRSCLLAHKRYRPRRPTYHGELRDLGFSKGTIYHHDSVYRAGWYLDARDARAVAGKTRHGNEVIARLWPATEFDMLRRAWLAGASVPYPVGWTDDGVLMEYVGSAEQAAPRLVAARLSGADLADAWSQLVASLRALSGHRIAHSDLSVYNLLWWEGRLVVIDFPQAVDAATNAEAPALLRRDLDNVSEWFVRRGVPVDVEALYAELVIELLR
jgi:RIO kinase 1